MTFRERLLRKLHQTAGPSLRIAVVLPEPPRCEWWTSAFANFEPTIDLYYPEHSLEAVEAVQAAAESRRQHWEPKATIAALGDAQRVFGLMSAAHVKKRHELRNGFEYDICITGTGSIEIGYDLPLPVRDTIYAPVTYDRPTMMFSASLDFLYGDSCTFDKACQLFRFMPLISVDSLRVENAGADHAMHYHLSMLGIEVEPL